MMKSWVFVLGAARLAGSALAAPIAILLTACTPAPPPSPVPPAVSIAPPSPTAAAQPSAAPSAAHALPPDAAPAGMLERLPAEARAEIEVLAALCPIGVQQKDGKVSAGCRACPSNAAPDPDRIPRLMDAGETIVEPQAHITGSFTAPGADEHLVMMNSCACNGCLDDAYLLRKEAGAFVVKAKAHVRSAYNCKRVRRKGEVDRALCDRALSRMGYVATVLEMYDFTTIPADDGTALEPVFTFAAVDDLALTCAPKAHFRRQSIARWDLSDADRDGQEDLSIEASIGDGEVTDAVLKVCAAEDGSAPMKGMPPLRSVKLAWTAAPGGFKPTPATAAELKRLDASRKKAQAQSGP